MIHEAKDDLIARGFTEVQQVEDSYGTIGYVVKFMGQRYILVAKEYAHKDLASFIAPLVEHTKEDIDFIFYCHDDDRFTVFDGEFLRNHAEESQGASKKRDASWREIPRDHGVDLHQYIRGDASPDTLAGPNQRLGEFA